MKNVIIAFLLFSTVRLYAAVDFHPDLKWKCIKTDHFSIYFHQGLESTAADLAKIAEKTHAELSPVIKWKPWQRTDVVLVDNMYTVNGYATPFPFNKIQIYVTRPEPGSLLSNTKDWLEMVFRHEYTHILNLDSIHGIPAISRYTVGRCCFPNLFLPVWMLEGNAVYHEAALPGYGRNASTYTDMIIRTEIENNSFKEISRASHFPRTWPTGRVPYLYGGLFVEYLEKKYGIGSYSDVLYLNSFNLIPYRDNTIPYILPFIDSSEEKVYKERFYKLWIEWEEFVDFKFSTQIRNIKKIKLTDFELITDSGYYTSLPKFSKDGKKIYYIRLTNSDKPSLMSCSIPDKKHTRLSDVNDPNSMCVLSDNRIYMSDAEYYKSFSVFNEAFVFDKKIKKISKGLRGSYIDINQKSNIAVFVKQDNNKFSLVLSDIGFVKFEKIIDDTDIQMAFARFSPADQRIALTLKDRSGNTDIGIYDMLTGETIRITNDRHADIHPCWSPDGKRIIFSSDRSGVFNLYEYGIDDEVLSRLTNLTGGAFWPDISPDGQKVAYANYGKNGFDIALTGYPDSYISSEKFNPEILQQDFYNNPEKTTINELREVSDYSIFNSLFPWLWVPYIASSKVNEQNTQLLFGLITLGSDTLGKNSYYLDTGYYAFEKRLSIDLNYNFSYFYPDIIINYFNNTFMFRDDGFPWEDNYQDYAIREMERSGNAGIAFPFNFFRSGHVLAFSYYYARKYTDIALSGSASRFKETSAKIRARYQYSNAELYSYSVSRENGREFNAVAEAYSGHLGSDRSYYKAKAEYNEYLPGIWRNNVIMPGLRAAYAGYEYPFDSGRFTKGESGIPKADTDEYGLRGYPLGRSSGNIMAVGMVEYRFPVIQKDLGIATIPIMFRDLWMNAFAECGNAWEDRIDYKNMKTSAGLELHTRITFGYQVDLQGCIGYARGFNRYGEDQVYFVISTFLEGAIKKSCKWLDYL